MTPLLRPRPLAGTLLPLLAALVLLPAPVRAEGLSGVQGTDPKHDTVSHARHTAAQRRAVDIREFSYTNDGAALTIATTVVDLAPTPGRAFVDTEVRQRVDGSLRTWVLSSRVGSEKVMIGTGSAFYRCEGATASADGAADVVTQVIPLACLDGFTSPRLRTTASLVRRNGSPIVDDHGARVRFDVTDAG